MLGGPTACQSTGESDHRRAADSGTEVDARSDAGGDAPIDSGNRGSLGDLSHLFSGEAETDEGSLSVDYSSLEASGGDLSGTLALESGGDRREVYGVTGSVDSDRSRAQLELDHRCMSCSGESESATYQVDLTPGGGSRSVEFGSFALVSGASTELASRVNGGVMAPSGGFMPVEVPDAGLAGDANFDGRLWLLDDQAPWGTGEFETQFSLEQEADGFSFGSGAIGGISVDSEQRAPYVVGESVEFRRDGSLLRFRIATGDGEVLVVAAFQGGLWHGVVARATAADVRQWETPPDVPVDAHLGGVTLGGGTE